MTTSIDDVTATDTRDTGVALLLVDMSNAFMGTDGLMPGFAAAVREAGVIDQAAGLLATARARGWLVAHAMIGFSAGYPEAPENDNLAARAGQHRALVAGTDSTLPVPELAPQDGEVIVVKPRRNAFHGTNLAQTLHRHQVKTLVLAGTPTDHVLRAALAASDHDIAAVVAAQACAGESERRHEAALGFLRDVSTVLDTEELMRRVKQGPDALADKPAHIRQVR